MKAFAKTALITGTAFGIPMGIFAGIAMGIARGYSDGVSVGLATAALSALAFGLPMAGFMAIQRRRVSRTRPEFTGENLLHDGPANHFLNGEGVGGWLYLTEQRLLFRSHQLNIQPHELSVPLAEISEAIPVRTAKVFPNGLRIVTCSGQNERFVVEAPSRWCAAIVSARTQSPVPTRGNEA